MKLPGALRRLGPPLLCDAVGLAGLGSVAYGAWLIYEPAGFIVGGLLAVATVVLVARRAA